jgi:hypothetical protein
MEDPQSQLILQNFLDGLCEVDDWILVEDDGDFAGMTLLADRKTGKVVYLSTRNCNDAGRWSTMPALTRFDALTVLDLHKSRYITELHEYVGDLQNLKRLVVTRCNNLRSLPSSLGNLRSLTEVRRCSTGMNILHLKVATKLTNSPYLCGYFCGSLIYSIPIRYQSSQSPLGV